MSLISAPSLPLPELDGRARDIFRRIVESYLETGDPVGSTTLSQAAARSGLKLSPASIRNSMQDLARLGLLGSPHTSAGRAPTHAGLRLFIDGLLEVGDLAESEQRAIEARLFAKSRSLEEALNEASALLSGLASGAGVVTAPARDGGVKHVEFVALGPDQTLAVMVFEDGSVENRLMTHPPGLTPSALAEASNFMNSRLRGRTLAEAGAETRAELEAARRELDQTAARLVEDGLAAWSGGVEAEPRHRRPEPLADLLRQFRELRLGLLIDLMTGAADDLDVDLPRGLVEALIMLVADEAADDRTHQRDRVEAGLDAGQLRLVGCRAAGCSEREPAR